MLSWKRATLNITPTFGIISILCFAFKKSRISQKWPWWIKCQTSSIECWYFKESSVKIIFFNAYKYPNDVEMILLIWKWCLMMMIVVLKIYKHFSLFLLWSKQEVKTKNRGDRRIEENETTNNVHLEKSMQEFCASRLKEFFEWAKTKQRQSEHRAFGRLCMCIWMWMFLCRLYACLCVCVCVHLVWFSAPSSSYSCSSKFLLIILQQSCPTNSFASICVHGYSHLLWFFFWLVLCNRDEYIYIMCLRFICVEPYLILRLNWNWI